MATLNLGKVRGEGLVSGGTEGQVLVKRTNDDFDTTWKTLVATVNEQRPDARGNVDIIAISTEQIDALFE